MDKIPLIVVCGPTAVGKTALAILLAEAYGGEIVSADSMQIYKGLNIATAKPSKDELAAVPHHLIDEISSDTDFSVADYVGLASSAIADIISRGKLPVICGGTGLYINSLIDNLSFDKTSADIKLRERYLAFAESNGNHALWEKLNEIDPASAATIHENNLKRVVRALEVYEQSGKKMSQARLDSRLKPSPYNPYMAGLSYSERSLLYEAVNKRVDLMLENGLVDEVNEAYKSGVMAKTSAQAIGYKELLPFINGECGLNDAVEILKRETRRYAKRQLTWFRRDRRIRWFFRDEYDSLEKISGKIQKDIAKTDFLCYNI